MEVTSLWPLWLSGSDHPRFGSRTEQAQLKVEYLKGLKVNDIVRPGRDFFFSKTFSNTLIYHNGKVQNLY